jgi:hypothetical protein
MQEERGNKTIKKGVNGIKMTKNMETIFKE